MGRTLTLTHSLPANITSLRYEGYRRIRLSWICYLRHCSPTWLTRSRLRPSFPLSFAPVGVTTHLRALLKLSRPLKNFSRNIIKLSRISTPPSQERWMSHIGRSSFLKARRPLIRRPIGSTCATSLKTACLMNFSSGYSSRATLKAKTLRRKSSISFSRRTCYSSSSSETERSTSR